MTSSPEQPVPLRTISRAVVDWVDRLGRVWVEGQVTQVQIRGQGLAFFTLRDVAADVSMSVHAQRQVLAALPSPLVEGARIVAQVKPTVWPSRGSLQLACFDIRPVGLGALLAQLDKLKRLLAAEGLFAPERKRPLPFLPQRVGLITGRASAAERDVVHNAQRRWPAVCFEIREVAVQGPGAVSAVTAALAELDAHPAVDVIVLARGGGSVEDLLPFSDESLCRAVAACRTPVVSAIGHEVDSPLVDLVADCRCSTPTDAGKRVVPEVAEERARVARDRQLLNRLAAGRVAQERAAVGALRDRAGRRLVACIETGRAEVGQLRARVRALSPLATLERGYALVLRGGHLVSRVGQVRPGDALSVRVADGTFAASASAVGSPR